MALPSPVTRRSIAFPYPNLIALETRLVTTCSIAVRSQMPRHSPSTARSIEQRATSATGAQSPITSRRRLSRSTFFDVEAQGAGGEAPDVEQRRRSADEIDRGASHRLYLRGERGARSTIVHDAKNEARVDLERVHVVAQIVTGDRDDRRPLAPWWPSPRSPRAIPRVHGATPQRHPSPRKPGGSAQRISLRTHRHMKGACTCRQA